MGFDWKEYHTLAQFLQGRSGSNFGMEASSRCAVSRSYYAAFCHARNYAQARYGFIPYNNAKDHGRVREHFKSRIPEVAEWLGDLIEWRRLCDYRNKVKNLRNMVACALEEAQQVLDTLK